MLPRELVLTKPSTAVHSDDDDEQYSNNGKTRGLEACNPGTCLFKALIAGNLWNGAYRLATE
jgi:hypothetical protein